MIGNCKKGIWDWNLGTSLCRLASTDNMDWKDGNGFLYLTIGWGLSNLAKFILSIDEARLSSEEWGWKNMDSKVCNLFFCLF